MMEMVQIYANKTDMNVAHLKKYLNSNDTKYLWELQGTFIKCSYMQ